MEIRKLIESSEQAFSVDADGFVGLHKARRPDEIVRELYQNVADLPEATFCEIEIRRDLVEGLTVITVEDDGPGYSEISDAWTLYRQTPKWLNPQMRGRFNRGNKEAAAYASQMTVRSGNVLVEFPPEGGRNVYRVRRRAGTLVTAHVDWDQATIDDVVRRVFEYRPTGLALRVNGLAAPEREAVASLRASMPTEVAAHQGAPLTRTRRVTDIDILRREDDSEGWAMELGIPVQEIGVMGFDVDVRQKIPLSERRNEITAGYQRRLKGLVMNAVHRLMAEDGFGENWVREAMLSPQIDDEAFEYAVSKAFGADPLMKSSDRDANMKAAEDGRNIIDGRSVGKDLADKLRGFGIRSARDRYGRGGEETDWNLDPVEILDVHREFEKWVVELAALAGFEATVRFYRQRGTRVAATCSADTRSPVVSFNLGNRWMTPTWFSQRGPSQLALIYHELGHAEARTPMEHGPKWGEGVAVVAAKISAAMKNG